MLTINPIYVSNNIINFSKINHVNLDNVDKIKYR